MPMVDHQFVLSRPSQVGELWAYAVVGRDRQEHGPFPSREAALRDAEQRFQRWRGRAWQCGGWAWRRTAHEWVVTVPPDVPVPGRPMDRLPCSRHQAPEAQGSSGQACLG